jgi:hypothetical protein
MFNKDKVDRDVKRKVLEEVEELMGKLMLDKFKQQAASSKEEVTDGDI